MGHEFGAGKKTIVADVVRMVVSVEKEIDWAVGDNACRAFCSQAGSTKRVCPSRINSVFAVGKGGEFAEENFNRPDVPNFDHSNVNLKETPNRKYSLRAQHSRRKCLQPASNKGSCKKNSLLFVSPVKPGSRVFVTC